MPLRSEHDVEVYDAQLRELRDDMERGAVPATEAASARAEIGRRLLKAASETAERQGEPSRVLGRTSSGVVVAAAVLLIVAAVPFYAWIGAPNEVDQPLAARLSVDPATADVRTLVAQAEAQLSRDPNDGRGWEALTPIYLRMGRADEAAKAAAKAVQLLGPSADRLAMQGEAEVQAASGEVTDAAGRTFRAALEADPANGPARFYVALQLSQQGKLGDALAAWQAIVDKGPADAPWMQAARFALEDGRRQLNVNAPAIASQPGPSAEDVAAAGTLSSADRAAMIEGMVSQLSERLKSAPNDPDGWKRLMRSYAVLGDRTKAREAFVQAQAAFAMGTEERRSIDDFAAGLDLGGTGTTE